MKKTEKNIGLLVVGLILNLFLIPGLGSLINKTKNGIGIFILALISIPLMFVFVGFITGFAAWIWGLIDMIQEFN